MSDFEEMQFHICWSIKMSGNSEKWLLQLPRAEDDVFQLLVLSEAVQDTRLFTMI